MVLGDKVAGDEVTSGTGVDEDDGGNAVDGAMQLEQLTRVEAIASSEREVIEADFFRSDSDARMGGMIEDASGGCSRASGV